MSSQHRVGQGWTCAPGAKIAHYFNDQGHSACHLWAQTTLDRPAPLAPRCPTCRDIIERPR